MYEWLLNTSTKNVYKNNEKEVVNGVPHVFFSNDNAAFLVASLIEEVEKELLSLNQRSEEISLEDQLFLKQAYNWMKSDNNKVKLDVFNMVHLLSQEKSLTIFEKSMETLLSHFKRKQHFAQERETDMEVYVEWLLELPYLIKERLENAFNLATVSLKYPITHHEVKHQNNTVGYFGNLEPAETRASSNELALCC